MSGNLAGKILCLAALPTASLSHVCLLYGPIPYPIIGAIAAGIAIAGLVIAPLPSGARDDFGFSVVCFVLAVLGLVAGVFYASVIGPFIVFFPSL